MGDTHNFPWHISTYRNMLQVGVIDWEDRGKPKMAEFFMKRNLLMYAENCELKLQSKGPRNSGAKILKKKAKNKVKKTATFAYNEQKYII